MRVDEELGGEVLEGELDLAERSLHPRQPLVHLIRQHDLIVEHAIAVVVEANADLIFVSVDSDDGALGGDECALS